MGGHRLHVIGLESQTLIRPRVILDRFTAAPTGQVRLFTVRPELSPQPLPLVGACHSDGWLAHPSSCVA